ncbi:MAG: hypothetical protein C5B43_00630 [Verrucomicrobia bacterium]|nr:MAG: hypothetical protein C5B43_00630 [Verrucomicrobiota bacterium]
MKSNIISLPNIVEETYLKLERYRELDQKIKLLTKEKEELSLELKEGYFEDNTQFIYNNRLIATCDMQIRTAISTEKLRKERPDIYNLFQVESVYKVLRLK